MRLSFSGLIVLSCFFITSCEKNKMPPYDILPLKTGNEFYYDYYKYSFRGLPEYTTGTEKWTVLSETESAGSVSWLIERTRNAVHELMGITDTISDSKTYLTIVEDESSDVIVFGFSFCRYQDVKEIELKKEGGTSTPSLTCVFKADSGLVRYHYYDPPNQITDERLQLDSLKTNL